MTDAALPRLTRFAFAALCLPVTQGMGSCGNWFDVLSLSESRVAMAVGDLVGHGPPPATVDALRSALAGYLLEGCPPADALTHLDRFARHIGGAPASSATCVVLNAKDQDLTWAAAGHLAPLVVDADGARYLDGATGTVPAGSRRPGYRQRHTAFGPGASLLLYSDGLIKRRGMPIEQGLARLASATTAAAAADTALRPLAPGHLLTSLRASLLADTGPDRDVTLLVARLAGDADRSARRTRITLIP